MSVSKINGQTILASGVTITDTQTTNATFYLTFVGSTSGTDNIEVDSSGLTYNSLTNTLTLGGGAGTLSGIATNGGGYAVRGALATASTSPTAGQTYYIGGNAINALSATAQTRRIYIPKAGTITAVYGHFQQTASGSANLGTLSVNVNNGGYTTIGTAAHNVNPSVYSNTGLSISVAVGDYIEFRWVCPATTAPTNVNAEVIAYIR